MLGQFAGDGDGVVIADLEAGIGTLTRLGDSAVDVLVLVAEPSPKSIEVASRGRAMAAEHGIRDVRVIANKIRDDGDAALVRETLGDVTIVPEDAAITAADRAGSAPLDAAPGSRAVLALAGFAATLRR